jgi:hypothetical protein
MMIRGAQPFDSSRLEAAARVSSRDVVAREHEP